MMMLTKISFSCCLWRLLTWLKSLILQSSCSKWNLSRYQSSEIDENILLGISSTSYRKLTANIARIQFNENFLPFYLTFNHESNVDIDVVECILFRALSLSHFRTNSICLSLKSISKSLRKFSSLMRPRFWFSLYMAQCRFVCLEYKWVSFFGVSSSLFLRRHRTTTMTLNNFMKIYTIDIFKHNSQRSSIAWY